MPHNCLTCRGPRTAWTVAFYRICNRLYGMHSTWQLMWYKFMGRCCKSFPVHCIPGPTVDGEGGGPSVRAVARARRDRPALRWTQGMLTHTCSQPLCGTRAGRRQLFSETGTDILTTRMPHHAVHKHIHTYKYSYTHTHSRQQRLTRWRDLAEIASNLPPDSEGQRSQAAGRLLRGECRDVCARACVCVCV
jgi:hypothetical protein